jgi:hypothetical protein
VRGETPMPAGAGGGRGGRRPRQEGVGVGEERRGRREGMRDGGRRGGWAAATPWLAETAIGVGRRWGWFGGEGE